MVCGAGSNVRTGSTDGDGAVETSGRGAPTGAGADADGGARSAGTIVGTITAGSVSQTAPLGSSCSLGSRIETTDTSMDSSSTISGSIASGSGDATASRDRGDAGSGRSCTCASTRNGRGTFGVRLEAARAAEGGCAVLGEATLPATDCVDLGASGSTMAITKNYSQHKTRQRLRGPPADRDDRPEGPFLIGGRAQASGPSTKRGAPRLHPG